jgi:hypothetical protein
VYAGRESAVLGYTVTAALNMPELVIDHCGPPGPLVNDTRCNRGTNKRAKCHLPGSRRGCAEPTIRGSKLREPLMPICRILILVAGVALAGCGAEMAGTAATVGTLQATQAQQAKAQKSQVEAKLGESMKAVQAAASAAGRD